MFKFKWEFSPKSKYDKISILHDFTHNTNTTVETFWNIISAFDYLFQFTEKWIFSKEWKRDGNRMSLYINASTEWKYIVHIDKRLSHENCTCCSPAFSCPNVKMQEKHKNQYTNFQHPKSNKTHHTQIKMQTKRKYKLKSRIHRYAQCTHRESMREWKTHTNI